MKIRNVLMSLLAIALFWACGKDEDPAPPKNTAPVIAAKTFTVAENIAPNTAIGTVTATDADKDALTFSIKTNDNNLFAITKAGILSLASGKSLNFATMAQHVITVAVSDGEASASAKVTINVTQVDPENLTPTIEAQQFEAIESISDTEVIGTVSATDPEDDTLGFAIAVNDNDLFEIDPLTGELSLAEGMKLAFGNAQEHTITIGVSDGNSTANADITIKVIEDLAPTGTAQEFSVVENIPDTEVIGTVVAEDSEGQPLTFSIVTNDSDMFEITADGELSLAEGMALDFETVEQHNIVVGASDGFKTTNINVTVLVEDDGVLADDPTSFVTTWMTDVDGESITIGTNAIYDYDYTIDWGDGSVQQLTDQNPTHEYAMAGTHIVAIQGIFPAIWMKESPSITKLMSIEQWGAINWQSMDSSFYGCENMVYHASDKPNLANVKILARMFLGCTSFNGNLSGWEVNNITDMRSTFSGAESFNGNISDWDVINVTNMGYMFNGASTFNQDIGGWDVSNVTKISYMFQNAASFNQDIGSWGDKLGNITSMFAMFKGASTFNQDIGGWDVSNVTNMALMFADTDQFNQDISGWDVNNVTNMGSMFQNASAFNQDLSSWKVNNVTNMNNLFYHAYAFNQSLAAWKISNVTDMGGMLNQCGMSQENLNATLISWSTPQQLYDPPLNITIGIDGLTFCGQEAFDAANALNQTYGWTFTGNYSVNPVCN